MEDVMIIMIEINDEEQIEEIMATGAKDLKEHFLPKANIYPNKISISHCTPKEKQKMLKGEDFTRYYEEC